MLTEVQPPFDLTAAKHSRIRRGKEGKTEQPHWHLPVVFCLSPLLLIKKGELSFKLILSASCIGSSKRQESQALQDCSMDIQSKQQGIRQF